ncbi:Membrane associated serine protease, rhomboid family [Tistlia consotensis]|uniref:Membrane associated serine protease, rhomboid family n=1 Tax=Tistlia consotensis USBA 355 TaxID=560819 RepID=A0A1Y6C9Q6_9PROT|nr:rhomboid family intramembrane serine protease [Tistlia consotensis]SMF53349.1 Membrane associated serine protease, rhomboid family [Tistlia consotensis USBA 355]SNR85415.1 Membrane associated serine protease, rhomboid family [Tistlia consotensis]
MPPLLDARTPPPPRRGQPSGLTLAPAPLALVVALLLVFAAQRLSPPDIAQWILVHGALLIFIGGQADWSRLYTLVTSLFLHDGWLHFGFNAFWLATIGSLVHRFVGPWRFLLIFFLGGIVGGLALVLSHWGETVIAIGASGSVFAFLGAGGHVFVARPDDTRAERLKRLAAFTVVMMALNLAFAFFGTLPGMDPVSVAWEAHAGGFLTGLLLFPLLARGREGGLPTSRGRGAPG